MKQPAAASQDKFIIGDLIRPVPVKLRRATGEVVIGSARLEYMILLGLKRSGLRGTLLEALQAASGVGGIEKRRGTLRKRMLARNSSSDIGLRTNRLFMLLGTLFKERNRLVHGTIGHDPTRGFSRLRVVRGARKDHRFDAIDPHREAERATRVAEQMMDAVAELDVLTQEIFWQPGVRIVGRGRKRRVVRP